MGRSSVEKLTPELRAKVDTLCQRFLAAEISLDQLKASVDLFAGEAAPSRSALHRHAQKAQALGERLARSRAMAEMLVDQVGPELADGKGFQVLTQAFQSLVFDLLINLEDGATLDPENLMFLARSIQSVASANKINADLALKLKAEAKKEAMAAVEKVAKTEGLTASTVEAFRAAITGVET